MTRLCYGCSMNRFEKQQQSNTMDNRMRNFVANELLLSSSSSSDDEDYNWDIRGPLVLRPRITTFVQDVVDDYSEGEFREHFRMYRGTFNFILNLIKNDIATNDDDNGRHTCSAKNQLLIAIWRFGTPDSYRSICSRFNIGKATAIRTVRRVTNALLNISNQIIAWPTNDERQEIIRAFAAMGFPGTVGCIDGSYIKISQPRENPRSYINRKGFAALILQGVCDHQLKFIHTTAGEVGSCHDGRVLRNSEVWEYMNRFPGDTHLVGDKAYALRPQLMTPYRDNGHLTDAQRHFNFCLSRVRSCIERAFCLLKKRFRCLHFLDVKDIVWGTRYIIACTVLHNICIMQNDNLELHEEDFDEHDDDNVVVDMGVQELRILGQNKRNAICDELFL